MDPFARPSRPAAAEETPEEPPVEQAPEALLSAEATEVPRTPLDSEVAGAAPDPEE
ncbi:MAG: hypothetical protein ACKOPT_03940 [Cyanobium sp.]